MAGLEGTSGHHLVQALCPSRATWSQVPTTVSRQPLNISKNGSPMNSLGNPWQCSVFLTVKCFLMFRGNHLCFSLCSLPLVLSLDTTIKSLPLSINSLPSTVHNKKISLSFFFSRLKSQLTDFPHRKYAPNYENTVLNLSVSNRMGRFLQGLNYCFKEI